VPTTQLSRTALSSSATTLSVANEPATTLPTQFCGAIALAYLCEGAWDAAMAEKVRRARRQRQVSSARQLTYYLQNLVCVPRAGL